MNISPSMRQLLRDFSAAPVDRTKGIMFSHMMVLDWLLENTHQGNLWIRGLLLVDDDAAEIASGEHLFCYRVDTANANDDSVQIALGLAKVKAVPIAPQ